jgi:hypothetical protein
MPKGSLFATGGGGVGFEPKLKPPSPVSKGSAFDF